MARQSALRTNDLAVIGVGMAVFLLAIGAVVAVGVASLVFGGGWVWPSGVAGAASLISGLASGHVTRGLDAPSAQRVPGSAAVWTVVVLVEVIVVAAAILFARVATQVWRPARSPSGIATRAEAAARLGRRRLTRRRAVQIRPDLYGMGET
jgi:hypothetical protein